MTEKEKRCYNCAGYNDSTEGTYCEYRRCIIEDIKNVCEDWEPDDETELRMRREEQTELKKQNEELERELAELRQAVTEYLNAEYGADDDSLKKMAELVGYRTLLCRACGNCRAAGCALDALRDPIPCVNGDQWVKKPEQSKEVQP